MKILVLTDAGLVTRWQLDAIDLIDSTETISVLSRRPRRTNADVDGNALYRLLSHSARQNRETAEVPIAASTKQIESHREFDVTGVTRDTNPLLPDDVLSDIKTSPPDAILDFGARPTLAEAALGLTVPILTYRFGDSSHTNAPPGFHEVLDGLPVIRQTVETVLGTGAPKVLALAETKVYPYSYKSTMLEAYKHSKLILNQALANLAYGAALPYSPMPNAAAPSSRDAVRFALKTSRSIAGRLFYGALVQKDWKVSTAAFGSTNGSSQTPDLSQIEHTKWDTPAVRAPHIFYADPFFQLDGISILVEGLNGRTGKGEIVQVGPNSAKTLSGAGTGHFSYPAVIEEGSVEYIVPETAQWSDPTAYRIVDGAMDAVAPLKFSQPMRFVDGSFFWHSGRLYLFCSHADVGGSALYLWSSDSLFSEFVPHPANPILISPRGARMAGGIWQTEAGIFRFGQDLTGGYGDGVYIFRIEELTPDSYREEIVGAFRFKDRHGPHTINFSHGRIVFDWYQERISPLAGVRRFRART